MQRRTSSKSSLFLLEMIFVILFFSLAAAVCVSLFAQAHAVSVKSSDLNAAVLRAQSAAECVKAEGAGFAELLDHAQSDGEDTLLYYDGEWRSTSQEGAVYCLRVTPVQTGDLFTAQIAVSRVGEEEPIYSLEAAKYL
ncbi:hypothetical protein [Zongyangia hominis]|uniref:Uncharacterized protein n=1 Tax=Zongyangia hominis TaxID=2763677 RepID=A0A926ICM1_9FIRM|nr:hypothetical protein [Zongyangia hominis]MBC8571367.1 hypothetical protein [Zongyangia hominis]